MLLFEQQGFEAVTVSDIVAAARVSVPTFYDHFPSKEHLLLQLPDAEDLRRLFATQPAELPLADRVRAMLLGYITALSAEEQREVLRRWRIVARAPGLRYRAAEFERTTAGILLDAVEPEEGEERTVAAVVLGACLSAYTQALMSWAEQGGTRPVGEFADRAFAALRHL